jgi:hypothetical protein
MVISRLLILAAFGLTLSTTTGLARDLRHPASGQPAFTLTVPDEWTSRTVDNGKSLSVSSDDRRIGFALTVDTTQKSIDEIIKEALTATKGTLLETKAASISSFPGLSHTWTYVNAGGFKLYVTMIMIQLDGKWLVSCTKLEVDGNAPALQQLADSVMQSVKLTTASK